MGKIRARSKTVLSYIRSKIFTWIEDWTIEAVVRYLLAFVAGSFSGSWSMSFLFPNIYAVISAAGLMATLFVWATYRYWPRKSAKSANWITWGLAITIIRDHPAGRKHMPNRTHYPTLDELEAFAEGRPTKYSQEMAAARGILGRIVKKYPHARKGDKKWTDDQYLENVIRDALDEMMLEGDDK